MGISTASCWLCLPDGLELTEGYNKHYELQTTSLQLLDVLNRCVRVGSLYVTPTIVKEQCNLWESWSDYTVVMVLRCLKRQSEIWNPTTLMYDKNTPGNIFRSVFEVWGCSKHLSHVEEFQLDTSENPISISFKHRLHFPQDSTVCNVKWRGAKCSTYITYIFILSEFWQIWGVRKQKLL